VVVALVLVLIVLAGAGAYVALKRVNLTPTPPTQASTAATEQPTASDTKADAPAETTGAATTPAAEQGSATTDSLSKYAGKWEFVGEPSPWGEGYGMELRVENGKLVGTSGMEGYEVKIELQEQNGMLQGQSTDSNNETIPLEITPTDNAGVMTLRYRITTGEWLTRVVKRQGSNADWVG